MSARIGRLRKLGGSALTLLVELELIFKDCEYRERTSSTPDPWLRDLVARLDACIVAADGVARGLSDSAAPYDAPISEPAIPPTSSTLQ